MNKKVKFIKISGVAVLVVTAVLLWCFGATPRQIDLESSDAQKIEATLVRAYSTLSLVGCNPDVDVSLLETVFVDTFDYRLKFAHRASITRILGPKVVLQARYLTALKAHQLARRSNQANVSINTSQDVVSTPRPYSYCPTPSPEIRLTYESIAINDHAALVRYDDGAATQEAVLVLLDGQWFVSSIRTIWVHF